jgi:hypothetical protein
MRVYAHSPYMESVTIAVAMYDTHSHAEKWHSGIDRNKTRIRNSCVWRCASQDSQDVENGKCLWPYHTLYRVGEALKQTVYAQWIYL